MSKQKSDDDFIAHLPVLMPEMCVRQRLAGVHLEAALPPDVLRAMRAGKPLLALVETPTLAWTKGLTSAASAVVAGSEVVSTSSRPRISDREEPPSPPTKPTFSISSNVAWLHPSIVAAADVRVKIGLDAKLVARVLRQVHRRRIDLAQADVAGLDLADLAMAIRRGAKLAETLERLRRAVATRAGGTLLADGPDLAACRGYGAALNQVERIADQVMAARDRALAPGRLPSFLLYGAPGTGKSRLAFAFAKTVGLPFFPSSIGTWFTSSDGFLGGVASQAQRLFEQAAAVAPSVVFLDELDGLPDRETLDGRGRDWWTPIITTVLLSVDAARQAGVVVVGATNYRDRLDAALLRPGRFDSHILLSAPASEAEIAAIFRACLGSDLPETDLGPVARLAGRQTGAVIDNWVRQARERARAGRRAITIDDLVAVVAPPETRDRRTLAQAAHHEAGHAVVGLALALKLVSVSLVETEIVGGHTRLEHGLEIATRDQIENWVVGLLAGRAADEIFGFGSNSGAMNDFAEATRYVAAIHNVLGLGRSFISRGGVTDAANGLSIDWELRKIVEADLRRLMESARNLVRAFAPAIAAVAERLMEVRVMNAAEVADLIEAYPPSKDWRSHLSAADNGALEAGGA